MADHLRQLLLLPVREGGLGLPDLQDIDAMYKTSSAICEPLVQAVVNNSPCNMYEISKLQQQIKTREQKTRSERIKTKSLSITNELPAPLKKCVSLAKKKGASAWLNVLPIESEGYCVNKSSFRDAMAIRYGLQPDHMPTKCVCSKPFDVEHALSCPTGGFPIIRHNEIRDLLANVMTETCHDVATEPQLQQVDRELPAGTNVQDGARLDISASGV